MKIFIACSKHFYHKIPEIKEQLERAGHKIQLPNSYDEPMKEEEMKNLSREEHQKWKSAMLKKDKENILPNDAILVLNFEKNGQPNYIGGATFLEIYKAWELGKKIYLYNSIPENILKDELTGFNPIILNQNLNEIQEKNIEVEIRSFISKEKYFELLEFFKKNAILTLDDFQETHYFDCEQDLRIQKNNLGSKIWMKKGKIHDDAREEIEIKTEKDDFEKLKKLFNNLNYNLEIKWLRERKEFMFKEIKISLDYTKGYGYIIELEKMSNEKEKEKTLEELKNTLKEINVLETPKEEFNFKYEEYKKNWRELLNEN